ncbi:helix-turn-helix domain-containing protein [Paenibacillus polymyxa]|uniref:helix-turn-helix domain-containing protein n=1 Tax=Paenibacillus polymyxa TaxID=1406 RepID=UPI0008CA9C94|nr:helix-turn-helix transcriptional regulator [Paenibacillus polymyxa]SEJ39777.1 DNA-binding transcriptional regulator, XRE-family HTH domain [Paenibacillus polymyxa]
MANKHKQHADDVNDLLREFGNNVYRQRTRGEGNPISQEKLAEKAGLHRTYIGAVERGEKNLTLFNICKIALALGIQPADLMEFEEETINAISEKL